MTASLSVRFLFRPEGAEREALGKAHKQANQFAEWCAGAGLEVWGPGGGEGPAHLSVPRDCCELVSVTQMDLAVALMLADRLDGEIVRINL